MKLSYAWLIIVMCLMLYVLCMCRLAYAEPSGALNPKVSQANIGRTICVHNWTTTIRPSNYTTNKIKRMLLAQSHFKDQVLLHYELDHMVSLELGGAPLDPDNLWLEPYAGKCGARVKDQIEDALHRLVCKGRITLAVAQHAIRTDWVAAYRRYVGPLSCGGNMAAPVRFRARHAP